MSKVYVVSEYLDFRRKSGIAETIELITTNYETASGLYEKLKENFIDDFNETIKGENKIATCTDKGVLIASIKLKRV